MESGRMNFAVILGGAVNPQILLPTASTIPYTAIGIALVILVSFGMVKLGSSKPLPTYALSSGPGRGMVRHGQNAS